MKKKIFYVVVSSLFFFGNASAQSILKKTLNDLESTGKEIISPFKKKKTEDTPTEQQSVKENNDDKTPPAIQHVIKPENVFDKAFHGKVKEITEVNMSGGKTTKNAYQFNESAQLTYMELNSYNGNVTIKLSYEYNDRGQTTKRNVEKIVRKDGVVGASNEIKDVSISEEPFVNKKFFIPSGSESESFYYNTAGQLEKSVYNYDYGAGPVVSESYYGPNGIIKKRIEKAGNNVTETLYDANGNPIVNSDYDDFGDYDDYDDFGEPQIKRDNSGHIVEYDDGNGTRRKLFYNVQGNLTKIEESSRYWGDSPTTYTNYVYDSQNNWTSRKITKKGDYYGANGLTVTTTRTIVYY